MEHKRTALFKFLKPVKSRGVYTHFKKSKSFLYSYNLLNPIFHLATAEIQPNRKCSEPGVYNETDFREEKTKKEAKSLSSSKHNIGKHKLSYVLTIPSSPNKSMEISFPSKSKTKCSNQISNNCKDRVNGIIFPLISRKIQLAASSVKTKSPNYKLKIISHIIHKSNAYNSNGCTQRANYLTNRRVNLAQPIADSIYHKLNVDRNECILLYPTLKLKEFSVFSYYKCIMVTNNEVEL